VLDKLIDLCIRFRVTVVAILTAVSLVLGTFALKIDVRTSFEDLLPSSHPYVEIDSRFKTSFGGSNLVSIMLQVEEGDIFRRPFLEKVQRITQALQQVSAVNQFQITSLASKKLKEVRASSEVIETVAVMWPEVPQSQVEIDALREAVVNNPFIYGNYVSRDLKATLITVDFIDRLIDYETTFGEVMNLLEREQEPGLRIHVVGDPILYGWVRYYLGETVVIFLMALAILALILFVAAGTWRGMILPMLSGLISALWALGIAQLLGFGFDPLVIVLALLISARAVSHAVQFVSRFQDEVNSRSYDAVTAARNSLRSLLHPGLLGLATDAGAMLVVIATPIPLLQKVAIIGCIWVSTIVLSAFVLTPLLLTWVREPRSAGVRFDAGRYLDMFLDGCAKLTTGRFARPLLAGAAVLFIVSGVFALDLTVGDANPGSPILWPDSRFNRDAAAINGAFAGSDRMFVVLTGKKDVVKRPEILKNIQGLQRHLEAQAEIGATVSVADVIPVMKQTLREGSPRYREIGSSATENAELLYVYVAGSDPGDLDQYTDVNFRHASITAFFRDRKGGTIRTAIARLKDYIRKNPMEQAEYLIAGGLVGVVAAVNEVILGGQIRSIALALLMVVIFCALTYRRTVAGMFFMTPVLLANTITFSFMVARDIGMNINTVPVAALGIGLGVDYSFYIVDRIREELRSDPDLARAIRRALRTAGRAVAITAITLCASVLVWTFSSLKFQAEMGLLIGLWLAVSALSALIVMPAMVYTIRPVFVIGGPHNKARLRTEASGT
jgi:predicted RND superfamily exporter protein